jgi:hypothetical protein
MRSRIHRSSHPPFHLHKLASQPSAEHPVTPAMRSAPTRSTEPLSRVLAALLLVAGGIFHAASCGFNRDCADGEVCECSGGEECYIGCDGDNCDQYCHDTRRCGGICDDGCSFECRSVDECSSSCGDDCRLDCHDTVACGAICGAGCVYDCRNTSRCGVVVGTGSTVTCSNTATCEIECTDSCLVTCNSVSACKVTCRGVFACGGCR